MDIDFSDYNGITFITGYNSDDDSGNGVGKTTISSALWYCLSGETPPKTKLANLANRKNKNKVFSTELTYDANNTNYRIVRNSKKLEFFIDGVEVTKTNTSTNEDILKSFSVDKLTLYQTLLVSVEGDLSFFDKSSSDKIKYIESVLNLRIFEKLFDDAKKVYNESKKEKDQLELSGEYLKRDINRLQTEFSTFSDKISLKISQLKDKISDNISKKSKLIVPVFKKVEDYENKKTKIEQNLKKSEHQIAILQNSIHKDQKEIVNLEKTLECPTCGKPFDDLHKKKDSIDSLNRSIESYKKELTEWQAKRKKSTEQLDKVREYEAKLREEKKVLDDISNTNELILNQEKEIRLVETEENPFLDMVQSKQTEYQQVFDKLISVRKECKVYETLKYVYSPEGVKNHIIKKIINLFNDILKNILVELNSPFKVSFDEYFEETLIHDGDEVAYGTMSRGEKARVMLAIVFTFRELRRLQTGFSLNISFYDEIFDTGLCKNGMTRCLGYLEKMNKSFVITHRTDSIDTSKYGRIYLVKKNGITSLKKEYDK